MPGITELLFLVTGKLPDGWERSETTNGIPYYINHETERTQWDHPEMVSLMEEIESLSNIKYAAYRTAMKLRAIQKKAQLYMVDLRVIKASLTKEGIKDGYVEGTLSVSELTRIITAIFINQTGDQDGSIDVSLASELVLNWILNVYDPGRMGFVPILSLKVALSVMCSEKVQEKYRYLFLQLCNNQGFLDRQRLKLFLQEMLQIPKYIYESTAFSGSSVEPAVRNCFERVSIPERVSAEEFIEWMIAEPQTIVWLPTLHRLAVSETVKHESKCNVCKMYPIVGFRYRCLKCFNFDLCQGCFWSGRVNKQHKIGHPTQEYCLVSTQKEDIKDFAKVMRNKVSKKKKKAPVHPSKGRFIPLEMEDAAPSDEEDEDYVDASSPVKVFPGTHDKLGSYAARLANHETKDDEEVTKERPVMARPVMDDEHHLIRHYTKSLTGEPSGELTSPSTSQVARDMDSQEKRDLEDLITTLENDNRALQGEINNIHHLQRQNQKEHSVIPVEDPAREAYLRQQRERLEAREEVLEEHNYQLQVQLHRLRILLQQEESTLSGLIKEEEKMATNFARERMGQICTDANYKPLTDDVSQLSPLMKSAVQPSSKPYTSHTPTETTAMAPLTSSQRNSAIGASAGNASGGVYPSSSIPGVSPTYPTSRPSSVPQTTFLTPGPSMQAYPPQYSLSPGISPPWRDAYQQSQTGAVRGPRRVVLLPQRQQQS
ncbi:hypothetical protein ACROYT_G044020 [Oculina patagonica]